MTRTDTHVGWVVKLAWLAAASALVSCQAPTPDPETAEDPFEEGEVDDGAGDPGGSATPPPGPESCVTIKRGGAGDVADAFLSGDHESYETGTEINMYSGVSSGGNINRVVMRFDLSPLPDPEFASITSATFRIYKSWSAGSSTIEIHRATAPWDELTVTRESFGTSFDSSAEATFSGASSSVKSLKSADLTGLAQQWHTGTFPNHGIVLDEAPVDWHHYLSSESQNFPLRPSLTVCYVTATCSDSVQNQGETAIDCGGPCTPCATCSDGIQNQAEQSVDCGGPCAACETCSDGIQNQGETAIDCGGSCTSCVTTSCKALKQHMPDTPSGFYTIDTDGAGPKPAVQVYCDMTTDGGGYTMVRFNDPSMGDTQVNYAAKCAQYGMEIIVPRTQAHMASIQTYNGGQFPNLVNVFPNYDGAAGLSNWHGKCQGVKCGFYLSEENNAWRNGFEPSGDSSTAFRLFRTSSACSLEAGSGGWNDAHDTVAIKSWVVCSTNDDCSNGACDPITVEHVEAAHHTCAALSDGTVKCWGNNGWGQLGVGDYHNRGDAQGEMCEGLPWTDLGTDAHAIQMAAGIHHSCALLDDGRVKCWGANSDGRLGLGHTSTRGDNPGEMGDNLPAVDLGTGKTAVQLVAGDYHNCAILNDGSVKCWGYNAHGQLGLGDKQSRGDNPGEMGDNLPAVDLGTGAVAVRIAAAASHTCARLADGAVKCWGHNLFGRLGLGDTLNRGDDPGEMGNNLPAVDLGTGKKAVELAAGDAHQCAILNDGTVKCWGYNGYGQLGLGNASSRGDGPNEMGASLPVVPLGAGKTALRLAAGVHHTCAVLNDGSVKCWGYNAHGQLGLGHLSSRGDHPGEMGDNLPVAPLGAGQIAVDIGAGGNHSCAILIGGGLKCWGRNSKGQLGYGDVQERGDQPGEMGDSLSQVCLF